MQRVPPQQNRTQSKLLISLVGPADSNLQPDRYERPALTIELQAPQRYSVQPLEGTGFVGQRLAGPAMPGRGSRRAVPGVVYSVERRSGNAAARLVTGDVHGRVGESPAPRAYRDLGPPPTLKPPAVAAYSTETPANSTTLRHFSVSFAISRPNSAGVIGLGMPAVSASRATSSGPSSASLTALLRRPTISGGVPLGPGDAVEADRVEARRGLGDGGNV